MAHSFYHLSTDSYNTVAGELYFELLIFQ